MQRNDDGADASVEFRILLFQASRDGIHLRLRLLQIDATFDPRNHLEVVISSIAHFLWRERDRHPKLILPAGKLECRRHHAGDRVALAVQHDRSPDDASICAKPALP